MTCLPWLDTLTTGLPQPLVRLWRLQLRRAWQLGTSESRIDAFERTENPHFAIEKSLHPKKANVCYTRALWAKDLIILNHGQVMRTTPELARPSPNFLTTQTRGRLSLNIFNVHLPQHDGSSLWCNIRLEIFLIAPVQTAHPTDLIGSRDVLTLLQALDPIQKVPANMCVKPNKASLPCEPISLSTYKKLAKLEFYQMWRNGEHLSPPCKVRLCTSPKLDFIKGGSHAWKQSGLEAVRLWAPYNPVSPRDARMFVTPVMLC
ncbi:hypothetical protein TNCV_4273241 [Trichonephila clavipes]|nr:hypothetical protein TNCV_4273241 [Trichonephila clavipes]